MTTPRILIILTSNARFGDTGRPTGWWAEEFALPYYAFTDAGAQVQLASPAGGAAPVDPGSVKPRGQNEPSVERWLADEALQKRLATTTRAADVDLAGFDALYFPGGHGTVFDLPHDAGVTRAVEQFFAAGKLVATVCHGAAALVSAKRADGRSVVQGRRVNAFTDAEEAAAGLTQAVPFLLETRLRELGANFEGAANWQPHVVRDGMLITGQNPQSSAVVAKALLEALTTVGGGAAR